MNFKRFTPSTLGIAFFTFVLANCPSWLLACAVCFKDPEDPQTKGMNASVIGLLAVTAIMLMAFAVFILIIRHRQKVYYENHPLVGAAFENPDSNSSPNPERDSRP